jgi:hypothetical protein
MVALLSALSSQANRQEVSKAHQAMPEPRGGDSEDVRPMS